MMHLACLWPSVVGCQSVRQQYMEELGSRSYSLSPVGSSSRRLLATPRKAKRKIPKVGR